jgi:hypothetical protein
MTVEPCYEFWISKVDAATSHLRIPPGAFANERLPGYAVNLGTWRSWRVLCSTGGKTFLAVLNSHQFPSLVMLAREQVGGILAQCLIGIHHFDLLRPDKRLTSLWYLNVELERPAPWFCHSS